MGELEGIRREAEIQLREHMLPFWTGLHDAENGGFYGLVTDDLRIHKDAEKGCILNSRILWFFSSAYRVLQDDTALREARHAYRFLAEAFLDRERGGVFWSVTAKGEPADDSKHCYCQAFAVYALSAYAQAEDMNDQLAKRDRIGSGVGTEALGLANELYDLMETRMRDSDGYREAFSRDFIPVPNEKLSENGVEAARTMNTALHVLEAYTELYLAGSRPDVRASLEKLLDIFLDRIYYKEKRRLGVFFDEKYTSLIDLYSYGHDIEAAWLIDRAVAAMGDYRREAEARAMTQALTAAVYRYGYREEDHRASFPAECERGVDKETRVWWVQAEAVNGLLNGMHTAIAQKDTALTKRYAEAVGRVWAYIRDVIIDPREAGEWFAEVSREGEPDHTKPIADPWKCPYHNGRMFMEIMRRMNKED